MTEIDADQRHMMSDHRTRQRQQGAVATDRDGEIGTGKQLIEGLARHDRVGRGAGKLCRAGIDSHRDTSRVQQPDELIDRFADTRAIGLANYCDGFEW